MPATPLSPSSPRKKSVRAYSAAKRDDCELRVQRALLEWDAGLHPSLSKAAEANRVAKTTLYDRSKGRLSKRDGLAHLQALTPSAETALVKHIERCAVGGFPLTPKAIRDLASELMRPIPGRRDYNLTLGRAWMQGFMIRHPSLDSRYSRCLENTRMRAVTVDGVNAFFSRLANIVEEYALKSNMLFNMDKTGFMMGQGGSQRVVVPSGPKAARFKAHAGNRDSTTVIECIGSGGQVIPPLVITKGKVHLYGDHRRMDNIDPAWTFGVSTNGWTSNDLACRWVEKVFNPSTTPSQSTDWRLLILDGHALHVSSEFLDMCWARRIIPLCLPPHSTHLMQPLDVSIFGPLTAAYRAEVNDLGGKADRIDQALFGKLYSKARDKVMTQSAAWKAFSDCGMTISPNAEKILLKLPGYKPPSEDQTPLPRQAPLTFETPRTKARIGRMLDAFRAASSPRDAAHLRRKLQNAFREPLAAQALLLAQEDRRQAAARTARRDIRQGDRKILSKDKMITRSDAELWVSQLTPQVEREQAVGPCRRRRTAPSPPADAASSGDDDDDEDVPADAPEASLGPLPAASPSPTPPPPPPAPSEPAPPIHNHPAEASGSMPWPSQYISPLHAFSPPYSDYPPAHTQYQAYNFYHFCPPPSGWPGL